MENFSHAPEKNVCVLLCWMSVLYMSVKSSWFRAPKNSKQCSYMIKFPFFNMPVIWRTDWKQEDSEEVVAEIQVRGDGAWTGGRQKSWRVADVFKK